MEKQAILMNGPSGSGKSTLARELQTLILNERRERYEIVSIDDFLNMSTLEPIYEDDVFEITQPMSAAVSAAIQTGSGVIVDHVITSRRIYERATAALRDCRLWLVHVTCPPEVLEFREAKRGNRCPGSAEASARFLFPKDGYDLTVDTHGMTAAECARRIFKRCFCPETAEPEK